MTAGRYLAEWCAAQPDRGTAEKVRELARLAGCSETQMYFVIEEKRNLPMTCARQLVAQLGLTTEGADHLLERFELPHLPTRVARERREKLLADMALASDLTCGPTHTLIADGAPDAAVEAALAVAVAALEGDRPTPAQLLDAAVPPLRTSHLDAALGRAPTCSRVAPRLWAVPAPGPDAAAAYVHHGLLSFAADALLRLPPTDRDVHSFTASVDEIGYEALDAVDRQLEADLVSLCEDAEVRVPTRVIAVLRQRLTVAGPFPAGASGGGVRWRASNIPLAPLDEAPAAPPEDGPPARPHPIGVTSFPTWLAIWRSWAKAAGVPCSDKDLAAQTGLSAASIYDLATGTVRFASDHVFPFLKPFGFEKDRPAQLALEGMAMVAANDDRRWTARLLRGLRQLGVDRGSPNLAADAHYVASEWFTRAICALASLPGFQLMEGWVSRAMSGRIDPDTARAALLALGRVGLLRRDAEGRAVLADPGVRIEGPHAAVALFELHRAQLALFQTELDHRDPGLRLSAWVTGLPEQGLPRLNRLIARWDDEVRAVLREAERRRLAGAPMDRVVLLGRQIFPVFLGLKAGRTRRAPRRRAAPPVEGA